MLSREPWQEVYARAYDAAAIAQRSSGNLEGANYYAEGAHQLRNEIAGGARFYQEPRRLSLAAQQQLCGVFCELWDELNDRGEAVGPRPFGPRRNGSVRCKSGSIASGGRREYCTCDTCF